MPKHWAKMVMKDTDFEYLRLKYIRMNVGLWGAVQEMMKEITHVKGEITKTKGKGKGESKDKDNSETEGAKSNKKKKVSNQS